MASLLPSAHPLFHGFLDPHRLKHLLFLLFLRVNDVFFFSSSSASDYDSILSQDCFMASQVVFLLGIAAITRPEEEDVASASDIIFGVLKLAWRASTGASLDRERVQEVSSLTARLQTSRDRSLFIFLCSISGSLAMLSLRWDSTSRLSSMEEVCRGASVGILYAVLHLYRKRMILAFPVIQVIIPFQQKGHSFSSSLMFIC